MNFRLFIFSMYGWTPLIIILLLLITARQLEATGLPKSSALGLFGIPGLTAYLGLMEIGKPKVD